MTAFNKTVHIANLLEGDIKGAQNMVFAEIKWDGRDLSITGVEGPRSDGNCRGACGQISRQASWMDCGVDLDEFMAIWEAWHLNDMRPYCEHQKALGWHIEAKVPYGNTTLNWVRPEEDPKGLLTKPCPVCGYKYGTEWRRDEVPEAVIAYLRGLPEAVIAYLRGLPDSSHRVPACWLK